MVYPYELHNITSTILQIKPLGIKLDFEQQNPRQGTSHQAPISSIKLVYRQPASPTFSPYYLLDEFHTCECSKLF